MNHLCLQLLVLPLLLGCSGSDTESATSANATSTTASSSSSGTAGSSSSSGTGGGGAVGEVPGYHDDISGKTAIVVNTGGTAFTCNQETDGEYLAFFVGAGAAMSYSHHDGGMETIPADGFLAVLVDINGGASTNKRQSTDGALTLDGPATGATLTGTFDVTFDVSESRSGSLTTMSCVIEL